MRPSTPIVARVLDAHDDAVAVHRLVQVVAGDVDALGARRVRWLRIDETESAGVRGHAAHDEVHAAGQAEPLSPNLDELAAGDQAADPSLERRPFLARDLQELKQLLRGGGMVRPLFYQLE